MGARTESPGSAPAVAPADILGAARGGADERHRLDATLAGLAEADRAAVLTATACTDGGLWALVLLRGHVLAHRGDEVGLDTVERSLRHELRSRFSPSALEFRPIGPDASDDLLDQVTACESVHLIRGRDDLLRRLHPLDRRCFALVHPALPEDPVVFVEVALGTGLAPSVQAVLDAEPPTVEPDGVDTATFYSINNCQEGLKGIPFGAELLHRAIDHLAATTPVTKFATLSPIPGFARWLDGHPAEQDGSLLAACARYLLTAKRGRQPLDPVARFHLGAGARLERLNPEGDTSARGLKRYRGITANYLYDRDDLAENQSAFDRGEVVASRAVTALLTDP